MKTKLCVYTICWNEAELMPYFLRHYSKFADKIVVFDEQSTDGTREIVAACQKAELRDWPHTGLDDNRFIEAVNTVYKEAAGKFDWVAWPDVDELLYHADIGKVLDETKADMLGAEGWAMISAIAPNGVSGQLYDHFRNGLRQPNYDKYIIWRPMFHVEHQHGRHTYAPDWPKCDGVKEVVPDLRLLHYHYLGIEKTAARHRRNYGRAMDKKFAWNYDSAHDGDPEQIGSYEWMLDALGGGKLINVLPDIPAQKKLHLGCGGYQIEGWENHDIDIDIRKPLPFEDGSVSHILFEHCIEHITHQEAWGFLEECYRVLSPYGVVRIAVPDIVRLNAGITDEYMKTAQAGGHGDGTKRSTIKSVIFDHGHMAVWSGEMLKAFIEVVGFTATQCNYGESAHPELCGVDQHWKTVGLEVAKCESAIVEGVTALARIPRTMVPVISGRPRKMVSPPAVPTPATSPSPQPEPSSNVVQNNPVFNGLGRDYRLENGGYNAPGYAPNPNRQLSMAEIAAAQLTEFMRRK